jgi:hypothetical protein
MAKHFQIGKVLRDALLLERGDEVVIGVEIGYDLESTLERDDLSLEMSLQDADTAGSRSVWSSLILSGSASPTHPCNRIPTSW